MPAREAGSHADLGIAAGGEVGAGAPSEGWGAIGTSAGLHPSRNLSRWASSVGFGVVDVGR